MAFTGDFTIAQTSDPTAFLINDTSTGSDPNITNRTIALTLADGTLLGGSLINWPPGEGAIKTISLLSRDYSISITVNWLSSSPLPSPSTYTKTSLYTFKQNTITFIYGLLQQLRASLNITNDTNWMGSLGDLQTYVDGAQTAGSFDDQNNAQYQLDLAYNLITNQSLYF